MFVADAVRGSQRWIEIGFFRFQPSELGKIMVALCLAGFLADHQREIGRLSTVLRAVALVGIPGLLVFIEPDFGTALMYFAILGVGLFVAGATWSHLAALIGTGSVAAASLLWVLPGAGLDILKPYQVQRLTGFLNPDLDPSGTTYNITQSITAVGSGGLDGRGVAGATQTNLNYLPEHATDFIFSSLAEQRGFFGASILLLLYALIVWRGLKVVAIAPGHLRRRGRGRARLLAHRPGVREHRDDDRDRTDHRYSAPVRLLRRQLDDREPDDDRRPRGDPHPRPPAGRS